MINGNRKLNYLFPTPLFQSKIIPEISWLEYIKGISYERVGNGWMSSSKDLLKEPPLSELLEKLTDEAKYFSQQELRILPTISVDFIRSWSMKHVKGDWAQNHCHTNSILSGIYYLDVFENSGELCFEKGTGNPSCFSTTLQPDLSEFVPCTSNWHTHYPEVGDLLIFPSHLMHSVTPNNTNRDRYCISFDIFYRGNISGIVI
jgi:uncharacterized protein (TIGR02466 family)